MRHKTRQLCVSNPYETIVLTVKKRRYALKYLDLGEKIFKLVL